MVRFARLTGACFALQMLLAPTAARAQPATPTVTPTPTPTTLSQAAAPATDSNPLIVELLRQINAVRVAAGRLPLAEASELDTAAQAHSDDMVAFGYLDHIGSDGSQPQDR